MRLVRGECEIAKEFSSDLTSSSPGKSGVLDEKRERECVWRCDHMQHTVSTEREGERRDMDHTKTPLPRSAPVCGHLECGVEPCQEVQLFNAVDDPPGAWQTVATARGQLQTHSQPLALMHLHTVDQTCTHAHRACHMQSACPIHNIHTLKHVTTYTKKGNKGLFHFTKL